MIYLVCPFDAPGFAHNVEANWLRQTARTRLVVVENGGATYAGKASHVVSVAGRGLAVAMRAGLGYVRSVARRGDVVAKVDADDHYEAGYAGALGDAIRGHRWSGFTRVRVLLQAWHRDRGGLPVRLIELRSDGHRCAGGTLAARVEDFAPYPDWTRGRADDLAWCEAMGLAGFVGRGPAHYTWVRRAGSVMPFSDEEFLSLRKCYGVDGGRILPSAHTLQRSREKQACRERFFQQQST